MLLSSTELKSNIKLVLLSLGVGILAGISSTIFLYCLNLVTNIRQENIFIIWSLPFVGLLIGVFYSRYGSDIEKGNDLVIEEIHDPQKHIPLRMLPLIFLGTLATHLFGGSAGREGTAVQMAASISDQFVAKWKVSSEERRKLLLAAAGAGFGSAIGAPLAGVFFGMEMIHIGGFKISAWRESVIASFVSYFVTLKLAAPHSVFPHVEVDEFSLKILLSLAVAGVFFGIVARLFIELTKQVKDFQKRFVSIKSFRPFVAGLLLVILYYLDGTYLYAGLGIETIQKSFFSHFNLQVPFFKLFLTSITVGSGFKGGEFIPLVFVGSTLASFLSQYLSISVSCLAALGFAAVFAGAANVPLACGVMAMELFGWKIGGYALFVCYISYLMSGDLGIYHSQVKLNHKHKYLHQVREKLKRRKSN